MDIKGGKGRVHKSHLQWDLWPPKNKTTSEVEDQLPKTVYVYSPIPTTRSRPRLDLRRRNLCLSQPLPSYYSPYLPPFVASVTTWVFPLLSPARPPTRLPCRGQTTSRFLSRAVSLPLSGRRKRDTPRLNEVLHEHTYLQTKPFELLPVFSVGSVPIVCPRLWKISSFEWKGLRIIYNL